MADPFIGEIRPFAFNFAPLDWLSCNGDQVTTQQFAALYAVIGNKYGGNQQLFNLPDLRGNAPVGMGAGPGLTVWELNDKRGTETVTLTSAQIPGHTHTAYAEQDSATSLTPANMIVAGIASGTSGNPLIYKNTPLDANIVNMNLSTIQSTGGDHAHENRQPFQTFNFCICYNGIFPVNPG